MPARDGKLADWFREWREPLVRFLSLRRLGTPADVDDIAQEVFLRLLRYERSELIDHPQAYLYKMAANVSAEWATRSHRRQPHHSEWLDQLVDHAEPEQELEREASEAELRRAIEYLPARPREILRLHFSEGLTYDEIADRMAVTRRIVKRDFVAAYAKLRGMLVEGQFSGASPRAGLEPESGQ